MKLNRTTDEIETYIDTEFGDDIKVTIQFSVLPGERGSRDSMGVPLEPDYGPELEDIEIISHPDLDYDELEQKQQDRIEDEIWDYLNRR
jgi:hypothetical protein